MKHSSSSDWITPVDFTANTDVDSRVVNNLSLSESTLTFGKIII